VEGALTSDLQLNLNVAELLAGNQNGVPNRGRGMFVESIKEINRARTAELSRELALPHWLVEALIVEYLPCRRYFEGGAEVLFDFSQIEADTIRQIPRPAVVLSDVHLLHNIPSSVVPRHLWGELFGIPNATLGEQKLVEPEGRVNPHHVPFSQSDDDFPRDWKHVLHDWAVVADSDGLYQWRVAESTVFSSEQLDELRHIHEEIICGVPSGEYPREGAALEECRARLAALYERLEAVRANMRATVVAFHTARKRAPEAAYGYTEEVPPTLTGFDQIGLRDNRLTIRTFVEPLFFRAAYQAMCRAQQAQEESIRDGATPAPLEDEIEASAACIILSVMCLEAYINGLIAENLPHQIKELGRKGLQLKWLKVPNLLGKPDCFDRGTLPFQNFGQLVNWRNDLVHYKHEFAEPEEIHSGVRVSKIHNICNLSNAQTAVETVRVMIRRLCENLGETVPIWARQGFPEKWLLGEVG
jgi:hypothetical protein